MPKMLVEFSHSNVKGASMTDPSPKTIPPAYVSFGAFLSFINKLRDTSIPQRIDRSLLGNQSGSLISALLASLRFFELVDDSQRPKPLMRRLVEAGDEERKQIFKELFQSGYSTILTHPDFHLESATTAQLTERFREAGVSGSTIAKCIALFLNLAKVADITVSHHIKAPTVPRTNGKKSGKGLGKRDAHSEMDSSNQPDMADHADEDVERFEIPIPGKPSVRVIVPRDLDGDDWEMLQSMITVYIKRWKGFKSGGDQA